MRMRILAAAVLASATLAACGSSGGGLVSGNGKVASSTPAGTRPGSGTSTPAATGILGGGGGDYCGVIKAEGAHLSSLEGQNSGSFMSNAAAVVTAIKHIDAIAPSDIKASWDVMATTMQGLVDALAKAGITPEQAQDPSKLSPAQLQAFGQASQSLATGAFADAAAKVSADVRTRCGVDIAGSASDTPAPSST
ncbi:MAG: hypothetical protein EPN43_07355 [Jatrophihabitans sp.]|nr:MAG: hypothetical protein EPN43_07355 [Jatrophihabitans sp.]